MSSARRADGDVVQPVLFRGLMLYFVSLPLVPAAFMALLAGEPMIALARAAAFGAMVSAANLIRRGIRLEMDTRRRGLRRRPSHVPYRKIGAGVLSAGMFILTSAGISGGGFIPDFSLVSSAFVSAAVFAGCYLYYDFDPVEPDPQIAATGLTTDEVVDLLDEAETRIVAIETAGRSINNFEFRDRLRNIAREARSILTTIENDPVDARRARKFLKVYLDGAQQVTEGYARTHQQDETPQLEDNFRRVLTTIETVIHEQQSRLRENNATDLDIKIEVLQMQLEKEGIS